MPPSEGRREAAVSANFAALTRIADFFLGRPPAQALETLYAPRRDATRNGRASGWLRAILRDRHLRERPRRRSPYVH
jgi:hypothetical protein